MKKYLLFLAPLLFCHQANAFEYYDYSSYSDEYNKCMSSMFESNLNTQQCIVDEYYRIRQGIIAMQNKLKPVPAFAEYNSVKSLSLFENVSKAEKYNEHVCNMRFALTQDENVLWRCKLESMNMLYGDLYNLNTIITQKNMKNR